MDVWEGGKEHIYVVTYAVVVLKELVLADLVGPSPRFVGTTLLVLIAVGYFVVPVIHVVVLVVVPFRPLPLSPTLLVHLVMIVDW